MRTITTRPETSATIFVVRWVSDGNAWVSEVKEDTQDAEHREALEKLGERMAEFSHDVRNSLAAILSLAELIESAGPDADRSALASKIRHHARQCKDLADDVLAMELREVKSERMSLNELIEQELDARPAQSGVELSSQLEEDIWVEANASRLRRILANLVENASRAVLTAGGGAITVTLSRSRETACMTVADDGPGMSADEAEAMFEPGRSESGGNGLGLALCRKLVLACDGTITHLPTESGCSIAVELPVASADARIDEEEADAFALPTPDECMRILVVDDDPTTLETYRMILELDGHVVTCVDSATACLAHLSTGSFDVLLADVRLRDLDGPELYKRVLLRHAAVARNIVFATGDLLNEETRSFLNTTGNPYLIKPFEIEELRTALSVAGGR